VPKRETTEPGAVRAAAVVVALAGIALLAWWLRDDPTPRAERADHVARPGAAARERREAPETRAARVPETMPVEVRIRRPDDTGVEGVTVRLVEQVEVARAVTGEDGVARFPKAPAALLLVWAMERRLGTVSPVEGERRLEYTVEGMLDLVVHVTCEGVARLPEGVRVTAPRLVDPVYDAERAEVRGRFVPPPDQRSIFVTLTAPGYAPTEVICGLRAALVIARADLTPRRRVVIAVTGIRVADVPDVLELETPNVLRQRMVEGQWQAEQVKGFAKSIRTEIEPNQWRLVHADRRFNLPSQEIAYELRPGRYRLRLKGTPVVMRQFDVDLSRVGTQEIVVRAPLGFAGVEARLQADWVWFRPDSYEEGAWRFSVLLPGDREVVLEPRHPLAEPAEPLRLVAAGGEVVVDLRPRPLIRYEQVLISTGGGAPTPGYEFLQDGKVVARGTAYAYGDGFAIPVEPGRYRLRIGTFEREIDVPEGGLDLGVITPR
jgi:hypothetical protein